jgi:5'-3' exonuclease
MSDAIVLVDLSSIAYPAWHTHGGDANPDACSQYIVARVLALASGAKHVAICADSPLSFRKELDATYKANRPEREAALTYQIQKAIDALRADGFPIWKADGFEADDLIATATNRAMEAGRDVLVISGDKDLLQLVCQTVTVKSARDGALLDEQAVFAKFGVYPNQIRDYLCLVGDSSDNVKGAEGIGPKKAAQLLAKHRTIDLLYADLEQRPATLGFTPGLASSLAAFKPRLGVVRQLVSLRTDAPITFDDIFRERIAAPMTTEPDMEPIDDDAPEPDAPKTAPANAVTALTPREPDVLAPAPVEWERQLEPRSMRDAKLLATDVFNSKLFMGAYGSPQAVLSTVLAGRELGMQAMASLRAIHIVEGKPTLSADLIRALVIRSGLAKYFRCTERTATRATFETQRGDDPPISLSFTIEEARQAWGKSLDAWDKSGWGKNPADMLVARAGAKLARLVYPDVVHGLYAPEELTDAREAVA